MNIKFTVLVVFLWLGAMACMALIIRQNQHSPIPQMTIRPLDHPRCFPPGTLATQGFPGCPDALPQMRSV